MTCFEHGERCPETERYNSKTDQWLPGGDPRLPKYRGVELSTDMNPGYLEMPGGWCIPADQIFEGWGPLTAPQGIMHPPTKKETHMPERQTKAQIQHELEMNRSLIQQLRERQQDLLRAQKVALPAEPPSSYTMFTVSLRFKMRGQRYQFLILRSAGHYFTTGTKKDQQVFSSWDSLCEWLEGPEVYDHTNIEILTGSGQVVDFNTGTIVAEDNQTPPY